ncbi:MAG: hypothetical protein JW829_15190 [Pirellulales bacterium]|nr:hypothetical protein [Pirellulales bacterium]
MMINLSAAWIGFFFGCLAGVVGGLFFHDNDWLGGYGSWRRRMIRLAHIAFFGIGLLNLSFALTIRILGNGSGDRIPSVLLIVGAVAMPLVCYLSAWKIAFRNLFFIPAISVTVGVGLVTWRILIQ